MSCSQCRGIATEFSDTIALKKLRQYRRRGPDKTTRILIDDVRAVLDAEQITAAMLLDVGAGIGAIHHELLNGRVERAVHVDASPAHMAAARDETGRRGHEDRVQFVDGDFTSLSDSLAAADIVTLDRVICCFDDMPLLVSLSAAKARRFYAAVYPRSELWMRFALGLINFVQKLKRSTFRVFLHDPRSINETLERGGLTRRSLRRTIGWEIVVYERRVR